MLAIRVGSGEAPVAGLAEGDTTATAVHEPGRVSLGLLEGLVTRACDASAPDLASLVALLARGLEARSACVFEVHKGEPVALATSGPVPDLSAHRGFAHLIRGGGMSDGALRAASLEGEVPLAVVTAGPGAERLGLVVAGELPFRRADVEVVLRIVLGLVQRLRPRALAPPPARPAEPPGLSFPDGYVPGDSPSMRSFYALMRPLLQGDLPVLLLGETGVGKEFLARILHDSSRRRGGPFVAINCAAIPADLLEAEMFGIGRGIATGVVERRGKFQMAEGGTLLLDEIGDMPLELQAKLLRALQEKEVQPVGGAPVAVDIRVIAATNSDLHRRMEEGRFRRDLYFRVAGFALRVPPLRERRSEIPTIVSYYINHYSAKFGRRDIQITPQTLDLLMVCDWPGNVRQLTNEIQRIIARAEDGTVITPDHLSPELRRTAPPTTGANTLMAPPSGLAATAAAQAIAQGLTLADAMAELERRMIAEALRKHNGNISRAARELGLTRRGLYLKLERHDLSASA
jgi:DNA-binding NtrC family response regulator